MAAFFTSMTYLGTKQKTILAPQNTPPWLDTFFQSFHPVRKCISVGIFGYTVWDTARYFSNGVIAGSYDESKVTKWEVRANVTCGKVLIFWCSKYLITRLIYMQGYCHVKHEFHTPTPFPRPPLRYVGASAFFRYQHSGDNSLKVKNKAYIMHLEVLLPCLLKSFTIFTGSNFIFSLQSGPRKCSQVSSPVFIFLRSWDQNSCI